MTGAQVQIPDTEARFSATAETNDTDSGVSYSGRSRFAGSLWGRRSTLSWRWRPIWPLPQPDRVGTGSGELDAMR